MRTTGRFSRLAEARTGISPSSSTAALSTVPPNSRQYGGVSVQPPPKLTRTGSATSASSRAMRGISIRSMPHAMWRKIAFQQPSSSPSSSKSRVFSGNSAVCASLSSRSRTCSPETSVRASCVGVPAHSASMTRCACTRSTISSSQRMAASISAKAKLSRRLSVSPCAASPRAMRSAAAEASCRVAHIGNSFASHSGSASSRPIQRLSFGLSVTPYTRGQNLPSASGSTESAVFSGSAPSKSAPLTTQPAPSRAFGPSRVSSSAHPGAQTAPRSTSAVIAAVSSSAPNVQTCRRQPSAPNARSPPSVRSCHSRVVPKWINSAGERRTNPSFVPPSFSQSTRRHSHSASDISPSGACSR